MIINKKYDKGTTHEISSAYQNYLRRGVLFRVTVFVGFNTGDVGFNTGETLASPDMLVQLLVDDSLTNNLQEANKFHSRSLSF